MLTKMKQYYNSLSIITKGWIFVSILFIIWPTFFYQFKDSWLV